MTSATLLAFSLGVSEAGPNQPCNRVGEVEVISLDFERAKSILRIGRERPWVIKEFVRAVVNHVWGHSMERRVCESLRLMSDVF